MKLSNDNTSVISPIQMVKQIGLTNTDESLVYNYPVVIDKSLQKEWGNLIRDFFTVQILSQIKSANILNITSSVASTAKIEEIDPNYRNPSDQLFNTLNNSNNPTVPNNNLNQYYSAATSIAQKQISAQSRSEIQFQLDSFREFIFAQIKNDPSYENLRPIATPITIEGFLNIPLIVGTKEFKTDSQALYWLLFLCLADNKELTSESTLKVINNYIQQIPKESFIKILDNNSEIDKKKLLGDPHSGKINRMIDSPIDVVFRRLEPIFNENRWLEEVGIGRASGNSLQISASQLDIQSFQSDVMIRFSNLFIGFINRDLLRIIQSLVYVLSPTTSDGIDFTFKYQSLINNFINLSKSNEADETQDLLSGIVSALYTELPDSVSTDNSNDVINKIESFCGDINKVSVKENFDEIHKLRMKLTEINHSNLLQFMDDFTSNINNLLAVTTIIKNFITSISGISSSSFNKIDRKIFSIIQAFFESKEHGDDQAIFDQNGQVPNIFHSITGINDMTRAKNFFATCYSSLTEFVSFCFYYSFMGHICEYFKELKVKIDVKRKNALSFPNFLMVIPSEYIVSLYNAMAYKRVSEIINSEKDDASSKFGSFKPTENDIGQMMRVLNERLKIPHIVVIDSKTKTVYYKWNYLNRTFKLNESSISNYIRTQRNLIQISS